MVHAWNSNGSFVKRYSREPQDMDASGSTTAELSTKRRCWNQREIADRYEQAQRLTATRLFAGPDPS